MLGNTIGGRYRITQYLGGGGFGQTYLATDLHRPGHPQCVVKQLKPKVKDGAALESARRLFDTEAQVLSVLGEHPQIPRLLAHFEEDHQFYLAQELIEGTLLSEELGPGQRLTEIQTRELLQDILETLAFVHQQQVVHRDIKPSNLIRRHADQKIVLIDFGSVKQIGSRPIQAADGQVSITIAIGSLGYMPNEQLAGQPCFSSDIYAVGMLAIQALTGINAKQLKKDLKTSEVVWRDQAHVSPEFADFIDTMVRYDFRQRHASAAEALAALRAITAFEDSSTAIMTPQAVAHQQAADAGYAAGLSDGYLAWLERGDELFQERRYEAALTCYEKVLQVRPEDSTVWFKQAIALEHLHRYEAAVAAYQQVIELQPDDYLVWFRQGKALEQLQQYSEALTAYDQVLRIQPTNYWAWQDRGHILEQLQDYEEAVAAYDRAVQLKPDFQLAVDSRKRVLQQLERVDQLYQLQHYEEVVESCDQSIQNQADDALAWLMRGMALENLGQYTAAVSSYKRVVRIQPDDHLAWYRQGTALERLQRYSEALAAYEQVAALQPENYWIWNDRARLLEQLGQLEEAMLSYDRAAQLKPDLDTALAGRQRVSDRLKQGKKLPHPDRAVGTRLNLDKSHPWSRYFTLEKTRP